MHTLEQVINELSKIPDGSLHVHMDRTNQIYHYRYSHWGLRFHPPVPVELADVAIQLEQKRRQLIAEFEFFMNDKTPKEVTRYRKLVKETRRRLLAHILADHRLHKEHYIYYTPHGDYVASKSEALISLLLMLMGITFHYELPLEISEKQFIRPDFTLIINGQRYYYEHLGKAYDSGYMAAWQSRLEQYHANNIYENDRLLVTKEYGNGLDLLNIRRQIQNFIDSKM